VTDIQPFKAYWKVASTFPADKERVYPEHATVQEFDSHRDKRVLEYGCGGGSDAMSYLRRGANVWFVDIVPENVATTERRIREAERRGEIVGPWVPWLLENSAPLPFTDALFSVVNAHGVIHHIPEPLPVLQEFHRVLRVDGLLYVMLYTEFLRAKWPTSTEMGSHLSAEQWDGEGFGTFTDGLGTPYSTYYYEGDGKKLLELAGFTVIKTTLYNNNDFRTYKAVKQ
jgi:SAM-dependent methyltransferase